MANRNTGRMSKTRLEKDTMGEMTIPAHALYGASTQRAVLNFPVSGRPVPFEIISAYAAIKSSCATVNQKLRRLSPARAALIRRACDEIAAGMPDSSGTPRWAEHFPIDVFQTGSGTSTNMNVNEVISNLICLYNRAPIGSSKDPNYLGGPKGKGVHPNDHVNMGQSSNDTFPTSIHVAGAVEICRELIPALAKMRAKLEQQAKAWDKLVKIGRTHLQDATPIRLGQEFGGFASQIAHAEHRARLALAALEELPIGGTAVGTGINAHEKFGRMVSAELAAHYKPLIPKLTPASLRKFAPKNLAPKFREAANHFEAQHAKDGVVEASSHLKTIAVSISKIASDIRLMGMGPRCGLGELKIPAVQPGSSIMPGKVNPVIIESAMMVVCQVIGNDAAITAAGMGGIGGLLDLHVAMPVMAERLLESIKLLARTAEVFTDNLLSGLEPDKARCNELIEGSLAMCTSLVPVIGYDRSAALAKEAYKQGKTVRQLALEQKIVSEKELNKYLDPWSMTLPGGEGSAGG